MQPCTDAGDSTAVPHLVKTNGHFVNIGNLGVHMRTILDFVL
jgi:hypothetical protein